MSVINPPSRLPHLDSFRYYESHSCTRIFYVQGIMSCELIEKSKQKESSETLWNIQFKKMGNLIYTTILISCYAKMILCQHVLSNTLLTFDNIINLLYGISIKCCSKRINKGVHSIHVSHYTCWDRSINRHHSCCLVDNNMIYTRVTLYTAGHLHTAVPHCSHSRAPLFTQPCPGRTMSTTVCVYVAGLCASCPAV